VQCSVFVAVIKIANFWKDEFVVILLLLGATSDRFMILSDSSSCFAGYTEWEDDKLSGLRTIESHP
jgi:hypothetical protein